MYKGFDIVYPEFEVITPQTHSSYTVKGMRVKEEESLKGSLLSPTRATEHLNRSVYSSVIKKPEGITDYKTFLQKTTVKDRDALVFGLFHISYGDIKNYEIKCSNCKKEYQVVVKTGSTFNLNPYPHDDILEKEIVFEVPISKISVTIKQPTLDEEEEAARNLSGIPNLTLDNIGETLMIQKMENIKADGTIISYTERYDIIQAFKDLVAGDKRFVFEKYNELFGKYGIELKMKSYCTHCGFEEVNTIDLVEQFFRMVYSS